MPDHPDTPPQPGIGGRHTLGSSPESQEPIERVVLPPLPPESDGSRVDLEAISGTWWRDARDRVPRLDEASRALFLAILDHVEAGWVHVAPLQAWYEAHRDHARESSDDYAQLLNFIRDDLVDVFRELASEVAALVPGYAGWEAEADPAEVEGDLDTFRRYFTVLRYAVEAMDTPAGSRDVVRAAAQGLAGWCTELAVLVTTVEESVIAPPGRRGRAGFTVSGETPSEPSTRGHPGT